MERKCKHCGGSFTGNRCPWCRTVYEDIPDNGWEGVLLLGGERIKGYVSGVEYSQPEMDVTIDEQGILHMRKQKQLRKFTFIEI